MHGGSPAEVRVLEVSLSLGGVSDLAVPPDELVNLEIAGPDLGPSRVPADELLARVDLLQHRKHRLVEGVVKEPAGGRASGLRAAVV